MWGILYLLFIFVGWLILLPYTRKTKKFVWSEYVAMTMVPLIGLIGLIVMKGEQVVWVYCIGVLIGPTVEHLGGWFYHQINGARLWTYGRYHLPGRYTSFLAAPLWGFFFVAVWIIVQSF